MHRPTPFGRYRPSIFALAIGWLGATMVGTSARPVGDAADGEVPDRIDPVVREGASRLRRPVALTWVGANLVTANQRSGSLSFLDPGAGRVVAEVDVGGRPADVVAVGDDRVLACDEAGGRLIELRRGAGGAWERSADVAVGASPVRVSVSPDGAVATVSLLWARRVAVVGLGGPGGGPPVVRRAVDLPFAPRAQVWLPGGRRVLVADSFGGGMAVVDPLAGRVTAVRTVDGNNVRGLAVAPDGERLVVSQSLLDPRLETTASHISWGGVVSNVLREVPLDEFEPAAAEPPGGRAVGRWSLYPLGETGRGAGDPGPVALGPGGGATAVALSGVGQVGVRRGGGELVRVTAGQRPAAVAWSPDGRQVVAADQFGDAVMVLDASAGRLVRAVSLGPRPPPAEADRGEQLFFDARLSHQGWFSCHSCHADGHSAGLRNDNLSDGSFATPKRILSALGTADTAPYAWNGSAATLEEQVRKSILNTMNARPEQATGEAVRALVAYLRTLPPPPGVDAARGTADPAAVARGRAAFDRLDCGRCHDPARAYTSGKAFDVGLPDERGQRRFNPPSLLGASQRDAWLHDGRARSLGDVFTVARHPDGKALAADEVRDLVAFLRAI